MCFDVECCCIIQTCLRAHVVAVPFVCSIQGDHSREHGVDADRRLTCDRQASANGDSMAINVEFVPLTSPEVAETLYRVDEAAYAAACGRTHMFHAKKRKRQLDTTMNADCLAMAQHGSSMKLQVGGKAETAIIGTFAELVHWNVVLKPLLTRCYSNIA